VTFADAVYHGRNRLMNNTIVAIPAIRSANDQRAASNRYGGSVEALGAALPCGTPAGGGGALEAAVGARLAPQFGQKVAVSAASL
jgi:hypothetical protein